MPAQDNDILVWNAARQQWVRSQSLPGDGLPQHGLSDSAKHASSIGQDRMMAADADGLPADAGFSKNEVMRKHDVWVCAYRNTSNQSLPAATWTKVEWNGESFDVGDDFDSVTNYRFVAPETGYYWVLASILFIPATSWAADADVRVAIYKNGALAKYGVFKPRDAAGTSAHTGQIFGLLSLAANHYIEIYVRSSQPAYVGWGASSSYLDISRVP